MKIDVDALFPPIRVDVLKHGATGGEYEHESIIERAGEKALEDLDHITWSRCRKLVRDLALKVLPAARVERITDEEVDTICQLMLTRQLQAIWQAVFDAHTFAWEEAIPPGDMEFELAMRYARQNFTKELARRDWWDYVIDDASPVGVKVWRPGRTWRPDEFREAAAEQIGLEKKDGERILVFDFAKMKPFKGILDHLVTLKADDVDWILYDAQEQFKDWAENYVTSVADFLLRNSLETAAGRVDFEKHWQAMLNDLQEQDAIREDFAFVIGA